METHEKSGAREWAPDQEDHHTIVVKPKHGAGEIANCLIPSSDRRDA
jgi:hypothetical protein